MKRAIVLAVSLAVLGLVGAHAVDLDSISLGLHLSPSIDTLDGQRAWDLSVSIGVVVDVTSQDSLDILAIIDSQPTTLGLSVRYKHAITDPFVLGGGLNIFWAFNEDETFVRTLIGSFVHGQVRRVLFDPIAGELGTSLPLLTLARSEDGWTFLPLTELPSVHITAEWLINPEAAWQGRVTLQPVITDASQFVDPIGQVTNNLLILPTYSTFLRYIP
jgi:hypothetical protein